MTSTFPRPPLRTDAPAPAIPELAGGAVPAPVRPAIGNGNHSAAITATRGVRAVRSFVTLEPAGAESTRLVRHVAEAAAHDMGNLLSVVGFNLDILASEALSPRGADAVRSLRVDATRLRDLAQELRMAATESKDPNLDLQTRLSAWWPDMRTLLRSVHRDGVIIRAHIPWGLPAVCIRPHKLTQAVRNLVENAANAIAERAPGGNGPGEPGHDAEGGEVDISARLAGQGRVVILTVADNGAGMSPEVLARACEPHFTTRADRGGKGLGLAIVQRLVGDAGGRVGLSSTVGVGTTVAIEIPARAGNEAFVYRAPAS